MKRTILLLFFSFVLFNCSSSMYRDDLKANELLISFTVAVQAGDYDKALQLISPKEHYLLLKDGLLTDESIRGMKNLKLSTLKRYEYWIDSGKLVGIAEIINGTAERTKVSREQRNERLQRRANTSVDQKKFEENEFENDSNEVQPSDTSSFIIEETPQKEDPKEENSSYINYNPYKKRRLEAQKSTKKDEPPSQSDSLSDAKAAEDGFFKPADVKVNAVDAGIEVVDDETLQEVMKEALEESSQSSPLPSSYSSIPLEPADISSSDKKEHSQAEESKAAPADTKTYSHEVE